MNRRGFLQAMLAAVAAPAIVQAANIMPVFVRRESGLLVPDYTDPDLIYRLVEQDVRECFQQLADKLARMPWPEYERYLLEAV